MIDRSLRIRSATLSLTIALLGTLAAAELPKGEVILDKYIEVTGGKAAYAKIHSDFATGTVELKAMGLKGKVNIYTAEPSKKYVEMNFDGVGKMQEGSDNEVSWSMSSMQGPRIKDGDEKAESILQSRFNAELNWRDMFTAAETVGVETVEGKECYKVVLTPKTGSPMTRWYDKDSNLLVKSSTTSKTPMGEIQAESVVSDYRKEGDVLMPHNVLLKMSTMEINITIDSVQHNSEIPKGTFDVPDEVKALLKKAN